MEKKIDSILDKLNKLDSLEMQMTEIKQNLQENIKSVKDDIEKIKLDIETSKAKEDSSRRKYNLLIFGLFGTSFSALFTEIKNIFEYLKLGSQLQNIDYFRKTNLKKDNSPVLIKLNSLLLKNQILKSKNLLNSSENFRSITIKEDFPISVREVRKELFTYLIDYKKQGNKVMLRGDKLVINGQLYTLAELKFQDNKSKRNRSEEKSPRGKNATSLKVNKKVKAIKDDQNQSEIDELNDDLFRDK